MCKELGKFCKSLKKILEESEYDSDDIEHLERMCKVHNKCLLAKERK